ncbi:MAG: ribosome small subunit-dependent GTPase A [bacterium]
MNLHDIGFDEWFVAQRAKLPDSDFEVARISAVDRERYLVLGEHGEVPAEITGRLRFGAESPLDFPAVGDFVLVQYHNTNSLAIVQSLLPRRTVLCRKTAGKRVAFQLIAANLDLAFVVQACDADFSVRRLERYLVMINEGSIEPAILLSKSDLVDAAELAQLRTSIHEAGIETEPLVLSNETGVGLDQVRELLQPGRTYCLLGSSGVGKTTLLNHLAGKEAFLTGAVREHDGKGRHTTTRRQLVVLADGAMMIDTPGMRELASIGAESGIDDSFADITALAQDCRFKDCTHTNENGCQVLAAVAGGQLGEERYLSYLKLARESAYHQLSYLEKRRQDRAFGRFVKSVLKDKKRR